MTNHHVRATLFQLVASGVHALYLVLFALPFATPLDQLFITLLCGVSFPFTLAGIWVCARSPREFPTHMVCLLWGVVPTVSVAALYHVPILNGIAVAIPPVPYVMFSAYLVAVSVLGLVLISIDPSWARRRG